MKFSKTTKTISLVLLFLLTFAVFAHFLGGFDPFNFKKIVVSDQFVGEKIYIDKVVMSRPGFVVVERVRLQNINFNPAVYQKLYVYLEAGTHIEIYLYESTESVYKGLFRAILFEDTNGNGFPEPREGDRFILHNNKPIEETFELR